MNTPIFTFVEIVVLIIGVISIVPAMMAPMGLDAPDSHKNTMMVSLVLSIMGIPFLCFGFGMLVPILSYFSGHGFRWLIFIPLVHFVLVMVVFTTLARKETGSS